MVIKMTREEKNHYKQDEIFNEEKKEKRKKTVIKVFKFSLLFALIITLAFFYTTYISTVKIIVNEKRIVNSKLPPSFNGAKLIQFSDLHYGSTYFYKETKDLVKIINERKPDIVVFTGDLIDSRYKLKAKEQEKLIKLLKSIDASLGKYAIMGEEDGEAFNTILNQSDFTILNNEYDLIYKDDNSPILITGQKSLLKNENNAEEAFKYFNEEQANKNIYTISLIHEPDTFKDSELLQMSDLVLAGHSHNGEIRIPYLGPLFKFAGAKSYYNSYYKEKNTAIYISSGLGTKKFDIRLFCRPSINFFRFSNK